MLYKIVIPRNIDMNKITIQTLKFILEFEGDIVRAKEGRDHIDFGGYYIDKDFFQPVEDELAYIKKNEKDKLLELYEDLALALYNLMSEEKIDVVDTSNGKIYFADMVNIFEKGKVSQYLGYD